MVVFLLVHITEGTTVSNLQLDIDGMTDIETE